MVFSSPIFLFAFLPLVFLLERLCPSLRLKNAVLAGASLVFYAFGNVQYVPLFLASVLLNYVTGLLLGGRFQRSRAVLTVSVSLSTLNVLLFGRAIRYMMNARSSAPSQYGRAFFVNATRQPVFFSMILSIVAY